jgi:hypothetical protein
MVARGRLHAEDFMLAHGTLALVTLTSLLATPARADDVEHALPALPVLNLQSTLVELERGLASDPAVGQKKKKKSGDKLDVGAIDGAVAPMGLNMGVGLQIGNPTAVTAKYMLTYNQGIGGGVGAGLGGVSLHVDYLWHPHVLARGEPFRLSWYIGGGGWLGFFPSLGGAIPLGLIYTGPFLTGYYNGHVGFVYVPAPFVWFMPSVAVRVPIGMSLALNELPIEIYGGVAPSVLLFPGLGLGIGFEVGARFYFGV